MTDDDKTLNVGRAVIDYCNVHTDYLHNKNSLDSCMEKIKSAAERRDGIVSGRVSEEWPSSKEVNAIVVEMARIEREAKVLKKKLDGFMVGAVIRDINEYT